MSDYTMILAFDTDDPEFVRGFLVWLSLEAGTIWMELGLLSRRCGNYSTTVAARNLEMVRRIAEAKGWEMSPVSVSDEDGNAYPEWIEVVLSRVDSDDPALEDQ